MQMSLVGMGGDFTFTLFLHEIIIKFPRGGHSFSVKRSQNPHLSWGRGVVGHAIDRCIIHP